MALQIQIRQFIVICYHVRRANQTFHVIIFSVIDSGKNDFEVTIKEAFHIKFSKPIMNKQLFTQGSFVLVNLRTIEVSNQRTLG